MRTPWSEEGRAPIGEEAPRGRDYITESSPLVLVAFAEVVDEHLFYRLVVGH
jgi:hypothetical protein